MRLLIMAPNMSVYRWYIDTHGLRHENHKGLVRYLDRPERLMGYRGSDLVVLFIGGDSTFLNRDIFQELIHMVVAGGYPFIYYDDFRYHHLPHDKLLNRLIRLLPIQRIAMNSW